MTENILETPHENDTPIDDDAICHYLREIQSCKILPRKEIYELCERYHTTGDKVAKAKLVEANLRLVISIAKKFRKWTMSDSIELEDLIAEGNIGLMQAIDRFDWRKGYALTTYATWWIKQAIRQYLTTKSRTIRLPAHVIDLNRKKRFALNTYKKKFGELPSDDELAETLGVSKKMKKALELAPTSVSSYDSPIGSDNDASIVASIPDHDSVTPFDAVMNKELRNAICESFATLSPKEEQIVRLRFGLVDPPDASAKWPITKAELAAIKKKSKG